MLSLSVYKIIHLAGVMMLFLSLGALLQHMLSGGSKESNSWRKQTAITHGLGVFLILLGGFGMLAQLTIAWPWPAWVHAKLVIWVVMSGVVALIYKKPAFAKALWLLLLVLGVAATYLGNVKPF